MDYNRYFLNVKSRFANVQSIEELKAVLFYDECFKMQWIATKLKLYSFLAYAETIDVTQIKNYSACCLKFALHNYQGLPRGFQNGIACFSILAGETVTPQAIDFVQKSSEKHYAAMVLPILVDLSKERLFYYQKTPVWGALYYKFLRTYILENFDCFRADSPAFPSY